MDSHPSECPSPATSVTPLNYTLTCHFLFWFHFHCTINPAFMFLHACRSEWKNWCNPKTLKHMCVYACVRVYARLLACVCGTWSLLVCRLSPWSNTRRSPNPILRLEGTSRHSAVCHQPWLQTPAAGLPGLWSSSWDQSGERVSVWLQDQSVVCLWSPWRRLVWSSGESVGGQRGVSVKVEISRIG